MIKKKKIFLLIFFLTAGLISSQILIKDNFYLKKTTFFTDVNNDSLIYYAKKLKSSKNLCHFYHALNLEVKAYYQKNNINLAKEKTLIVLENLKDKNKYCFKKNKITALNRLFWIYKNQNQFQKAFDVLLKREKIVKSLLI